MYNSDWLRMILLLKNITYLYLVRIVGLVSPLVLIPHLYQSLGADKFGALFFAQSFILYLGIVIDFGFELYAPGKAAVISDSEDLSLLVSKIQASKIFISIVALFIGLAIILLAGLNISKELFLAWFFMTFIQSSIPIWFFQGKGELSSISIFQATGRILSVVLTFLIVKNESDSIFYPVIESFVLLAISMMTWKLYFKMGLGFRRVRKSDIMDILRDSFPLLVSKISISLYTVSGTFILGVLSSPKMVAFYAAPMKVMETIGSLMGPINQVIYPYLSAKSADREVSSVNLKMLKRYIYGSFICGALCTMTLLLFQDIIVSKYLKAQVPMVKEIFQILAFLPAFIFSSNVLGIQILLGFGKQRDFSKIISISSLIGFFLILLLTFYYQGRGTAYAVLLSEVMISLFMYLKVRRSIL